MWKKAKSGRISFCNGDGKKVLLLAEKNNSPAGNRIPAYSSERTLCEIMTVNAATDIQVITYAIKSVNKK
jgi:hypothetical protein